MKTTIEEIVKKTPATRDRYVDFLRAFSIIVVVIGHWLSAVVIKNENGIRVNNAVGMIPGLWILTWVLQVMPLFFFVGGFSNARTINSLRNKGESLIAFYKKRAVRLLKPTVFFLIIWIIITIFFVILVPEWQKYRIGIIATVGPLWFLAVYLFVTLISPFMLTLHRSKKLLIPVILLILTALIDYIRFKFDVPAIAWLNVFSVWVFVHQIGYFYEDGSLVNLPFVAKFLIAISGLAGLSILTNTGIYPKSMIGTGFEKISNMNPPTICISFLSLWLIGLAMILRDKINKWLDKATPWFFVVLANQTIMTLYLWHLTAYTISFLILYQFGLGHHTLDNISVWWLERPVFLIMPAIILIGLIKIFGRLEKSGI
ncbi:MAG: acyltransferase [candidate division WOR-3 bacterium]